MLGLSALANHLRERSFAGSLLIVLAMICFSSERRDRTARSLNRYRCNGNSNPDSTVLSRDGLSLLRRPLHRATNRGNGVARRDQRLDLPAQAGSFGVMLHARYT